MKKLFFLASLFLLLFSNTHAQDKKVAVVTFYTNKIIDVTEFGSATYLAVHNLVKDTAFHMSPLLKKFHTAFFDTYSKDFPFQLLPEQEVLSNPAYQAFTARGEGGTGLLADSGNLPYKGYKVIPRIMGHANEQDMLKIFQCDGVMKVAVTFKLVKIGFGGMGVVKVNAHADIALFNKDGNTVFSVSEDAKSKNVNALIAGVPVITTDKILPMCESAMNELIIVLEKDLPKMIKKTDAKL
jgi:hypothetical protein